MEIEIDEAAGLARIAGTPYTADELLELVEQACKAIAKLSPGHRDHAGNASFGGTVPVQVEHLTGAPNDMLWCGLSFVLPSLGRVGVRLSLLGAAELSQLIGAYLATAIGVAFAQNERANAAKSGDGGQTIQ